VKAVACELPARYGLPLGRFSRTELYRLVIELAVTEVSASTVWRWLHEDAIKPLAAAVLDPPARPRVRGEGRPGA